MKNPRGNVDVFGVFSCFSPVLAGGGCGRRQAADNKALSTIKSVRVGGRPRNNQPQRAENKAVLTGGWTPVNKIPLWCVCRSLSFGVFVVK
jgi:hypothetical protein